MPARRNNQRYLLWLALGTTFMAAAMAVLLALQVTQQQSIRKSSDLRSDSITALAFQVTIPRQSRGHSGCEPLKAAVRGR